MGIFAFPRIHVKGLIAINVGTANNDDYSTATFPPGSKFAGQPVRLADSKNVQPLTYDMSDDDWIAWVQAPQTFEKPAPAGSAPAASPQGEISAMSSKAEQPESARQSKVYVPAEWNYYGDMGMNMMGVEVIGVQSSDPPSTGDATDPLIGAELSFKNRAGSTGRSTAMLIDVNPEDVPCSQVFSDSLTLEQDGKALFTAKPTKAVTRWINFQRNTGLNGPNGASCLFQCAVPIEALQGQPILDRLADGPSGERLQGLVFRYIFFRPLQKINTFKYDTAAWDREIVALYQKKGMNPDYAQLVGTIAPWYAGEPESSPVGRLLNPTKTTIPIPNNKGNVPPPFQLAPAVLNVDERLGLISVDFSGTFPDAYSDPNYNPLQTDTNPKYDFGPVNLFLTDGTESHDLGAVPYQDTGAGDHRGWIFDFPLAGLPSEVSSLIETGTFSLRHPTLGDLLAEEEYLIVSDQSCIFGEQVMKKGATTSAFMNEGPSEEPATIRVYQRGIELTPDQCPDLTIWEYDTTPNQAPGNLEKLATNFKPGQALDVAVEESGNRLYTFTLAGQADPPTSYGDLSLMTVPMINLRILPNDRDYSRYYIDPSVPQPVGNDSLTFDVIYSEVLRNYYLLYPAMSLRIPLNDPEQWADPEMAGRMMQRIQKTWFDKAEYMPRTRDLSESRRTLLQAWCLKFLTPPTS
jgi:hypothetical protein